jgi:hypothetical protein
LLDALVDGQGFDRGENKTARNECVTGKEQYGAVSVALDPTQGLSEFKQRHPQANRILINGRDAMEFSESTGTCIVAVAVGNSQSARINTVSVDTEADFCPEARKYAEELEPKLPDVQ